MSASSSLVAALQHATQANAKVQTQLKELLDLLADEDELPRCLFCNNSYGRTDGFNGWLDAVTAACGCRGVGISCAKGRRDTIGFVSHGCGLQGEKCFRCRQQPPPRAPPTTILQAVLPCKWVQEDGTRATSNNFLSTYDDSMVHVKAYTDAARIYNCCFYQGSGRTRCSCLWCRS